MGNNLTLTPADEPLWMMAYAAACTGVLAHYGNGGSAVPFVEVCTPFADAAIHALRERRVASVEFDRAALMHSIDNSVIRVVGEPSPALTPERARQVMAEYVAKGTWNRMCCDNWHGGEGRFVDIDISDVISSTTNGWRTGNTITTEAGLRRFCEGRGE